MQAEAEAKAKEDEKKKKKKEEESKEPDTKSAEAEANKIVVPEKNEDKKTAIKKAKTLKKAAKTLQTPSPIDEAMGEVKTHAQGTEDGDSNE